MPQPDDDKIEQLVRSVLAAVDARLLEVRNEFHELADLVEQRHREALQHMQDLERRLERRAADGSAATAGGDPLAARMEQATQVLLERIEAMHQRNTIATNERFALINEAIAQIRGEHAAASVTVPVMPALDAMNAPLRVGPPTGQQPVIMADAQPTIVPPVQAPVPTFTSPATAAAITAPITAPITTPIIAPVPAPAVPPLAPLTPTLSSTPLATTPAPATTAPAATTEETVPAPSPDADAQAAPAGGEIDLAKLADLLGERLGHLNIKPPTT